MRNIELSNGVGEAQYCMLSLMPCRNPLAQYVGLWHAPVASPRPGKRLAFLFARIPAAVAGLLTKGGQISNAGGTGSVFPNIAIRLSAFATSKA